MTNNPLYLDRDTKQMHYSQDKISTNTARCAVFLRQLGYFLDFIQDVGILQ